MQLTRFKNLRLAMCTAVLICGVFNSAWADDYQQGFVAYIDGEFSLAQRHWLRAANAKDAKSMFNLGLLHEKNKLENASIDKALNWYRLAAENGYAPAGYHLAQRMLERGGSDDEAMALTRRAAQAGYAPAKRYLGIPDTFSTQRQVEYQVKSVSPAKSDDQQVQAERWINRHPPQNWTIQLLAFTQKEQVVSFIKDHGLQRDAAYFLEANNGNNFYKLVYGSYDSKEQANLARQNLSSALRQHGPWLRTWASVHRITRQDN